MMQFVWLTVSAVVLLTCVPSVSSTRVKGSLAYDQEKKKGFLFFLSRFGVGKGHQMFVYGKVERSTNDFIPFHSLLTLAFIPQGAWDGVYNLASRNDYYAHNKCHQVITSALNGSRMMGDDRCLVNTTQDYLRAIPCDHINGEYTSCNQPPFVNVIDGFDFTFHIASSPKTEYYYLFLMTCTRNFSASTNCEWASTDAISVNYDIKLVNSRPNETNPYTNEFSYDLQGALTLQLFFIILYLSLIGVHFVLHSRFCTERRYRTHLLVKIFSVSLVLESLFVLLELLHYSIYAGNGQGVVVLKYFGEVANQFSDWLLILVVILVGKGWQVTTSSLRWSKVTVVIWGAYIFFSAGYFVWMVVSEQVYPLSLSLYHSYQSWVGGVYLTYRLFILTYLLYEMRQVYRIEIRPMALRLYVILAVCYIIWFCYLPLVTLILLAVNPLYRRLAMSTIYLVFDFLINLGMVVLFCPKWANRFFQFNNYINLLSKTPYTYKSLKSYGGGRATPTPI